MPNPAQVPPEGRYDVVVVGGGVYGVMALFEASRRGLRALLLERDSFAEHTSAQSLRIAHGGLRYLQHLDFRRFRESVGERDWLLRTFPDQVRPLPCLMPLFGAGLRRTSVLRVALMLNDSLIARQLGQRSSRLPSSRILSRRETLDAVPHLDATRLQGAALWHDATMDPLPLIEEALRRSRSLGGEALSRCEVTGIRTAGDEILGVVARSGDGQELFFATPRVLNCAGPWSQAFAHSVASDRPTLFIPSLAFNLAFDLKSDLEVALAVSPTPGTGPLLFAYQAPDSFLTGTGHFPRSPDRTHPPTEDELSSFASDIQRALPWLPLGRDRISAVHWGLLPATRAGEAAVARHPAVFDHGGAAGPRGLVSLSGVKWTTARHVVERGLRLCFGGDLPEDRTRWAR